MSGIVGIYHHGGSVQSHTLAQMLTALTHRGPDGSRLWQREGIGLGHCMLWTTPESLREVLPYHHTASGLVITADARIDNRTELLDALALNTLDAQDVADSQIILAAYQKWGQDCPNHLLGDFAFAIWDDQNQTLFCARDHFGIKPFYYYSSGQHFIFASEIKALLALPNIPRLLNEQRIADYLLPPMLEDQSITIYKNIVRLPPAHWVTISAHKEAQPHCYWVLKCPSSSITLPSDADYAGAFRDIFFEAVRCRLRSAFPVGSHLSGGLDSSTVTCVAHAILQQHPPTTLHTFSSIFENPNCDEREYFNHVLEQGRYQSHLVQADQFGPLSKWETFFQHFDEPFLGPNHFLVHELNQAAQKAGVRVCLDGFDGDTVVSHGAVYFTELASQGDWSTFIAEAKAVSKHFDTSPGALLLNYAVPYLSELAKQHRWLTFAQRAYEISQNFTFPLSKIWLQYGLKPHVPTAFLRLLKKLRHRNQGGNKSEDILNHTFRAQMNAQDLRKNRGFNQSQPSTVAEDQCRDLTSGSFTHIIELLDQGSSAFSIESRHPFMDKRLIEFCLALPPSQKLSQGWSRAIMRRAMGGVLPEQIRWRGGKTSLEDSFEKGLLIKDRALIEQALLEGGRSARFLNLRLLQSSLQNFVVSGGKHQDAAMQLWKGGILSLWLQHKGWGDKSE